MKIEEDKFKNLFYFAMTLIFLLGICLRFSAMHLSDGLWYDEMNTYFIAKQKFPDCLLNTLFERDLHLPFYYVLLHFWMSIFGDSDLALRISSIIPGILTLLFAYHAGKELSGRKGGISALFLFSINSSLIYFSQEVRFYSLLVLFSTMVAYFLIKIKNQESKLCYLGLLISNLLIIYTFTMGFVFVFLEIILFFLYLKLYNRDKKYFVIAVLGIILFSLPLLPLFKFFYIKSLNLWLNYFDYYQFNIEYIWITLMSIGSPVLPYYWCWPIFNSNNFIWIANFIFLLFIFKALIKKDFVIFLFLVAFSFILLEIIIAIFNNFAFSYCHLILAVPFLLIVAAHGLYNWRSRFLFFVFVSTYLFIQIGFFEFSPYSVIRVARGDGYNIIAQDLKHLDATRNDALIIFPDGGEIAEKYDYTAKLLPIYFNDYSVVSGKALDHVFDRKFINSLNKKNAFDKLDIFLNSKEPSDSFKVYLDNEINKNVGKGRYLYLNVFNNFENDEIKGTKTMLRQRINRKIFSDILYIMKNNNKFSSEYKIAVMDHWHYYIFQRIR